MISISAISADSNGAVILSRTEIVPMTYNRRVTRTPTLDGGCYIIDTGVTDSDRTFSIKAETTKADETALNYLMKTYSLLSISLSDGFFTGVIESLTISEGETTIRFIVKERI